MVRRDVIATTAAVLGVILITGTACGTGPPGAAPGSVITSTTVIAGAGVLGNERRPDESCAPEPARADPGPEWRRVHNAPGVDPETTEVPADPQRIVVLAGDQLDALCALGLQAHIAAAALPDGSPDQPSYLGATVHDLPGVGTRSAPDLGAVAATHPDLILGSQALTPKLYPALARIAPTVFTSPSSATAMGAAWEYNLRRVGAATARAGAADELVDKFVEHAAAVGAQHDATHYQASVVQLTDDTVRVYGSANFAASVLRAVGLDRPAAQRFTDRPYIDIGATDADLAGAADFSAADADIVYLSFASPTARRRAPAVLDSGPWRKLSANRDGRVFVVNNEVWQTGQGLIAARGIVEDLHWVNAPVN